MIKLTESIQIIIRIKQNFVVKQFINKYVHYINKSQTNIMLKKGKQYNHPTFGTNKSTPKIYTK